MCIYSAHICFNLVLNLKFNAMSEYQKYWNNEIEKLLSMLDASNELFEELSFVIGNSSLTQIFPNQVINALKIAISIKNGEKNIALVAPMQSGKSGTAYVLCNYILPSIGIIGDQQSVLFVTSMMDKDLYTQNKRNLEKDFYSKTDNCYKHSYINVIKMSDFFNHPNPHKVVSDYNVKLIVRDEDQYGCGQESSFDSAFFNSLRNKMPKIKLLAISATPYDILDAKTRGYEVDVIEGERPEGYYGITEMLRDNMIEDYPRDFRPTESVYVNGNEKFILNSKIDEYIKYLLEFESGLGIIRVSNTVSAINTRDTIRNSYGNSIVSIVIGSNSDCDFKIKDGLAEIKKQVISQKKKVVLIVLHALSAGKDLRLLKEKVRFGIECRNKQLANGSQGIAGRLCGYHNNRNFKLLASIDLLEHYSRFEQDWEIFSDENWQNELYNQKIRGLSTQTKFTLNQKAGIFTPIVEINEYSIEDLKSKSIKNELNYMGDNALDKLLDLFDESFYERSFKYRFNEEGVTVRIASNYNPGSNRVFKNWNSKISDDFGNIFFKKNTYEYGFLVCNYPADDERNILGFCGIKIFRAGTPYMCNQETKVINSSMYNLEEIENNLTMDQHIGLMSSKQALT